MNEEEFFSRKYRLTCPVWLIVDLKKWGKGNETADALQLLKGKPSLGPFLPIFLDPAVADGVAKEIKLLGCGAIEIASPDQLCRVLAFLLKVVPEVPNAVIYLEKNRTRFYRFEDLWEELEGYRNN
jgi:hypothetical protein